MNHCCMTLSASPLGPEEAVNLIEHEREQAVDDEEVRGEERDGHNRDDGRVPDLMGRGPRRPAQLRAHVAHELADAREEVVARALTQPALATRRAPLLALAVPRHARGRARRRPRQVARLLMTRSHLFVLSIRHRLPIHLSEPDAHLQCCLRWQLAQSTSHFAISPRIRSTLQPQSRALETSVSFSCGSLWWNSR